MAIELLGKNLDEVMKVCGRRFSLETVINIQDQIVNTNILHINKLRRIEHVHSKDYIHRDIKPENFCIGLGSKNEAIVYMIDFGLAKRY